MNTDPGDSREQIVGVLADLTPNQFRLLVRPAGDDAGDPTSVEAKALALFAFVFFFHVACGETREEFAGRSIMEHWEARLAPPVPEPGADGEESGSWVARWRRIIPLLRKEIAALRADASLPSHVAADLVALRVFSGAASEGLLW